MRYALNPAVPPASEPVATADLKAHLRVFGTSEDALIAGLGTAARQQAEAYTNRSFVTQTWDLALDAFPEGTEIPLPRPPLQSVSYLKYFDAGGTEQTWGTANYFVDAKNVPPRLVRDPAVPWPDTDRRPNAVTIRYMAGYGTAGTDVPESLRLGIKVLAAHLYEHRGDAEPAGLAEMPKAAEHIMFPWRAF